MVCRILMFATLLCSILLSASEWTTFTENNGQWPENVRFKSEMKGAQVYWENNTWTFQVIEFQEHDHDGHNSAEVHAKHAFQMEFVNGNAFPEILTNEKLPFYHNYFLGADRSKWAGNVAVFESIHYDNLFPCVDVAIAFDKNEDLKYNYILEPGTPPNIISWRYNGIESAVIEQGALKIKNLINHCIESIPEAFQLIDGNKHPLVCAYVQEEDRYTFAINNYNPDYEIVIDPKLVFSTYTGSTADNWGTTATYDVNKNAFGGGNTTGTGYPTSLGAYAEDYSGGTVSGYSNWDVTISKYSDDGYTLLYSTYLGGGETEVPHSMIVNDNNELFVLGTTSSLDFPILSNAYSNQHAGGSFITPLSGVTYNQGSDIFVVKFSADGSQLLGSTYIGGSANDGLNDSGTSSLEYNYGDHARGEIIIDGNGNPIIASCTVSSDFPTTAGSYQNNLGGLQDGVVFKLNSELTDLQWSTYLGGTLNDACYSLKQDSNADIFIAGGTTGGNFPILPTGSGLNSLYLGGQSDGFLMKLSPNGANQIASTYIGTNEYDQAYFVEIDGDDLVYAYGQTTGDYPVFPATTYNNAGSSQFIHRLENDLTSTSFSTVFGSGSASINISPTAFLVDICKRIYVAGWGGNINTLQHNSLTGNTNNMATTIGAEMTTTDGSDFYLMVLEEGASDLLYATYFGTNGLNEHVDGGTSRFDNSGTVYQSACAGCGGSDDFPTTPNSTSQVNGATNCNMAVFVFDFEFDKAEIIPSFDDNSIFEDITVCLDPETGIHNQFFFTTNDQSTDAIYHWFFGDGGESFQANPIHNYTAPGIYEIQAVVIDSITCNIVSDTSSLILEVLEADLLNVDFSYALGNPCDGEYEAIFTNESTIVGTEYSTYWDFTGLGIFIPSNSPNFTFPGPGTHDVSMVIIDSLPCLNTDTITQTITVNEVFAVTADFELPNSSCVPYQFEENLNTQNSLTNVTWNISNGDSFNTPVISYLFDQSGTYNIELIVEDPMSCNGSDTLSQEITIVDIPNAGITVVNAIQPLVPISFEAINDYGNTYTYNWNFGDGTSDNTVTTEHTYQSTGTYNVCLTISSPEGCSNEVCTSINLTSSDYVILPTAFSPNGDDKHEILRLVHDGLKTVTVSIYNRWGELVVTSTNPDHIWDGTNELEPCEIGVYVYTLEAEMVTGRQVNESGNVTLLK